MMRRLEAGSALLYAILVMIIVAALAAGFTQMVMSSVERAKTRRDKVSQDAVVETAQTRIQYALQNDLISEMDGYNLTASDFKALANDGKSVPTTTLPTQFRNSGGIWKYNSAGSSLSKVGNLNVIAMREALSDAGAACKSVGMATTSCASTIRGYWQPFRVDYPDISGRHAPNTVITIRTWLGTSDAKAVSDPRYVRFEWRPGRFADFQMISDGFITFSKGATINGPVHSNSYSIDETTSGAYKVGVNGGVDASKAACFGQASITVTKGFVKTSPSCKTWAKTGQSINFTRAVEAIDTIRTYAVNGTPGAYQFADTNKNGYYLTLNGNYASLSGPGINRTIPFNTNYVGIVVPGDVWVHGTVGAEKRVTIAAQHKNGGTADIHVNGNITKGDPKSSSIGLMASGNVVLAVSPCISNIQAAMIAATGSITIPPEMAVAERIANPKPCTSKLRITGSIAGHGPPVMLNQWPTGESVGYEFRTYEWDKQLRRNPPPFFPLTGTWQAVSVKEANVDCLFNASKASNPDCR